MRAAYARAVGRLLSCEVSMQFKTVLDCGGTITADFPDRPKMVRVQCTCGNNVDMRFSMGVWGGLYVSAAQHCVAPTAPVAKRNSRKSSGAVSSKRRGG